MNIYADIETIPCKKDEKLSLLGISPQISDEDYQKLSLQAEFGRILCIGVIVEKDGIEVKKGVLGFDTQTKEFHLNEEKTLRGFWKLICEFNLKSDLIIGHNIMDFYLPFIYKRSRILQINPTIRFNFACYRSAPIMTRCENGHYGI